MDLSDVFWQIPLDKDDRQKTSFTIPVKALFHFVSLPFYHLLMDAVMGYDLETYVFVYLDDIIIATDTFDEHVQLLNEVGVRIQVQILAFRVSYK